MAPHRIQLRRTKGWTKPVGAVVVSRPSRWGNPYRVGETGPEIAVARYRQALHDGHLAVTIADVRRDLAGRDLCCWCPPGQACHADVLIDEANR